jgi:hypothetical protein
MEASQHRLARQQLDLENRQREFDNFEATVRQRERDVQEAEAAHAKAKSDEIALVKKAVLAPTSKKSVSNADVAQWLLKSGRPIKVIPRTPYDATMIKDIKQKGLIMTTDIRPGTYWRTILHVSHAAREGGKAVEFDVVQTHYHGISGGHVILTLIPTDNDWNFFKVTSFTVNEQYPMPPAVLRYLPATNKLNEIPAASLALEAPL